MEDVFTTDIGRCIKLDSLIVEVRELQHVTNRIGEIGRWRQCP